MAEGIDAASFDFYEGIRILIPGAITLSLVDGAVRTFSDDGHGLGLGTFALFVTSLLLGLLFYFADAPTKAAVFAPLRPTDTLFAWKLRPKAGMNTLNVYFVMLDTDIPGPIRARALYMGSMFRIGFEAVYLLSLGAAMVLAAPLTVAGSVSPRWSASAYTDRPHLLFAVGSVILLVLFAIRRDRIERASERKKSPKPTDVRTKHFSFLDALLAIAVLVAGVLLLVCWQDVRGFVLGGLVLMLYLLWAVRYFKGYRNKDGAGRRPIAAVHACLLLGIGHVALLLTLPLVDQSGSRALSGTESRAWTVVLVAGLFLACARGHEKRLRGAYVTQSTWLELNKQDIVDKYFVDPARPVQAADAAPETPSLWRRIISKTE